MNLEMVTWIIPKNPAKKKYIGIIVFTLMYSIMVLVSKHAINDEIAMADVFRNILPPKFFTSIFII